MRAALACFRIEIFRDRRVVLMSLGVATILAVAAAAIPWTGSDPVAVMVMAAAGIGGFFLSFRPIGQLLGDRMSGRLAAERALPIPWLVVAAARLTGAAVRLLIVPAFLLVILVGIDREQAIPWFVYLAAPLAAWCVAVAASWTIMAINVRWSLIRLWWVPTTIWFGPQFLPQTWRAAIWQAVQPLGRWAVEAWNSPTGPQTAIAVALGTVAFVGVGAALLYASGLKRYVHNPDPLGLQGKRDRVTRILEYPPGPRPVTTAIALLDVRLGLERVKKQGIPLLVLIAVGLFGPGSLRDLAPTYIRIIGWMVPGAVLLGIMTSRHSGALATLQQLPWPHWQVGAGKAGGVVILSLVGASVAAMSRLVDPTEAPYSTLQFLNATLQLATGVWVGIAIATWWQRRYAIRVGAAAAAAATLIALDRSAAMSVWVELRILAVHPGALVVALTLSLAIGVPMFAQGLGRYQKG